MTFSEFLRGILVNSSILLAMVTIFGLTRGSFVKLNHKTSKWKTGILFGLAATVTMLIPVITRQGMIFDSRSAVTGAAGLIGGPITALISLPLPLVYRIYVGGDGMLPGIMELIFPAILGSICHLWLARKKKKLNIKLISISGVIIGIGSNLIILILILILMPGALTGVNKIAIPLLSLNTTLSLILLASLILLDRERFQMAKDLAESQRRLDITLDSIGDAVIACDVDGHITRINPEASRLTGWPHGEAIGQEISTVLKTIDQFTREPSIDSAERVMRDGHIIGLSRDALLITRSGSEVNIANSAAPINDNDGTLIGIIVVFRDISHEVMLEHQLRQSQKMDAIGKLASGIAHDFNNMLVGILGNTNLLELKLQDQPDKLKLLNSISDCAHNAADITRHLLTFSRKSNINDIPINLHKCIQSSVNLISHTFERNIEITQDLHAKNDIIIGDEASLQQVLLNLSINAHHAMKGSDGCLEFRTLILKINDDDVQNMKAGEVLKLIVSDNGTGISPDNIEKIFDPFFTTKEQGEGTGMGLATAYGIVKRMNGHISVESQLNKGTTFTLFFPLSEEKIQKEEKKTRRMVKGSGTILVIEDEEHVRKIFRMALDDMGYDAIFQNDGVDGLEWFKNNHMQTDLVLLDLNMPRMNGAECFKEMKKIKPDVRCILASGHIEEGLTERFKEEGAIDMLYKPFTLVHLSECVAKALV